MRISEAIEELNQDLLDTGERKSETLRAAQRLGIEALKHHRHVEKGLPRGVVKLLPGEDAE